MNRRQLWSTIIAVSLLACLASLAQAQPMGRNVSEMKLMAVPPLPTCATASVENGDPSKGPSIIFAKLTAGCSVPWHWHTPNEHLMMVSGSAKLETKDGKPLTLKSGAFAMMPSKHIHQFRCSTACSLYVYSDGSFDTHYVDAQGQELAADAALKAVKEKTVKQ